MYSKEELAIDFRALGIKAGDSVMLLHAISFMTGEVSDSIRI
jgi:aminoglycoside N3'-acetyltransferase